MDHRSSTTTGSPSDQAQRDRFTKEIGGSFSVIAPAGTGKTRAIVDRIVNIALSNQMGAESLLPRLVVVTYTNKAAEEMRSRALNELMMKSVGTTAMSMLRRAFFGTIHSFCGELLRRFGPMAGLPPDFEIVTDDQALWLEFFGKTDSFTQFLPLETQKGIMRHLPLPRILELARYFRLPSGEFENKPATPYPQLQLEPLLNFEASNKRALNSILEGQEFIRAWQAELESKSGFLPIPEFGKGGKDFQNLWKSCFTPLRDWLESASLNLIGEIAYQYRRFRISSGRLTYDDLIDLAVDLVRDKNAGQKIRQSGYRILLDEAQDTDVRQFEVLTEATRPPGAVGLWLETGEDPPEPGRFCMVGDPQQSIYSSRADLPTYHRIHGNLVESGAAEELVFSVTFRCSENIVSTVNEFFPNILTGGRLNNRQAAFVPLFARTGANRGQVSKIPLEPSCDLNSVNAEQSRARNFSRVFAKWFRNQTLESFQAADFSEVAILCPRNEWLRSLNGELCDVGFKTQLHPGSGSLGGNPAFLWFTALLTVVSQPENSFEIYGVLREIFGISDHDLAEFCRQQTLQILHPMEVEGIVQAALNELAKIRRTLAGKTLRDGVSHLMETVCLKERLSLLPEHPEEELIKVLEELLAAASRAETERLSLEEWAVALNGQFSRTSAITSVQPGHVQLLSCHMAKGLEWDAVILPFLHRQIRFGHQTYPALRQVDSTADPRLALDNQHKYPDLEVKEAENRSLELERLLYVATTRARHSLVLIDDQAFFQKSPQSFAEKLRVLSDGDNVDVWLRLPGTLEPALEKKVEERAAQIHSSYSYRHEELEASCYADAKASAANFIERILPSSLSDGQRVSPARDEPEPLLGHGFPEESLSLDGAAYGNWWHEMMEITPWHEKPEVWKRHFNNFISHCPQPERGVREIQLFLSSDFAKKLARPGWAIRTEIPFLWQADKTTAYEGLIDLAARETDTGRWIIVDWKTDRLENGHPSESLKSRYGKQVGVYTRAVQSIYEEEVETFLYSTPIASSIRLD